MDLSSIIVFLFISVSHGIMTVKHPSFCPHIKHGSLPFSKTRLHRDLQPGLPVVETKYVVNKGKGDFFSSKSETVLFQVVNNPGRTFSVLEPLQPGSCKNESGIFATVRESAKQKNCILATSGGFFNQHNGECYGNLYSDGRLVVNSGGLQMVYFGITEDGFIFIGYLSEEDLLRHKFKQLIGGMLWLIRDGKPYIKKSMEKACSYIAEMDDLTEYPRVNSARLIVGHDKRGRILIFQTNGKTKYFGLDLYDTLPILRDLGFVNAVSLDGGTSTTVVINGTVVSHPSYPCNESYFSCERAVSTILCVHDPSEQQGDHPGSQTDQNRCPGLTSTLWSTGQYFEDCISPANAFFYRWWIPLLKYHDALVITSLSLNIIFIFVILTGCIKYYNYKLHQTNSVLKRE